MDHFLTYDGFSALANMLHPWSLVLLIVFSFLNVFVTERLLQRWGPEIESNILYRYVWRRFGRLGFWLLWACLLSIVVIGSLVLAAPALALGLALLYFVLVIHDLAVLWGLSSGNLSVADAPQNDQHHRMAWWMTEAAFLAVAVGLLFVLWLGLDVHPAVATVLAVLVGMFGAGMVQGPLASFLRARAGLGKRA